MSANMPLVALPVRPPIVRAFLGNDLVVDSFAGGGGASTGIELALGRSPDLAINHDAEALAMHAANHPTTKHRIESVWAVDPIEACGGKPVAFAWFSPDCKHFSKSKGGKPRDQKIRGLAWVAVRWAQVVRPRVIALENVEEFQDWGPLDCEGLPIRSRKGQTFRAFVRKLERLGYVVEWRLLRACDFGAPTTRRRLFLVARCDGHPIAWPVPTHGTIQRFRTASDCIDWSVPCSSLLDRGRQLAANTLRRVARGANVFAINAARPFVVQIDGQDAVPWLVHRSNGERVGQAPRIYDIREPLRTIVAQGQKQALCVAFLAKHYGGHESARGGTALDVPLDTVTAQDHHSLVQLAIGDDIGRARRVADFLRLHGVDVGEVATVLVAGVRRLIVDIAMRMLTPRELFRAQGFSDDYAIDPIGPNGRPLTKTAQIRMCGNSVPPPIAAAIVRAQFSEAA